MDFGRDDSQVEEEDGGNDVQVNLQSQSRLGLGIELYQRIAVATPKRISITPATWTV